MHAKLLGIYNIDDTLSWSKHIKEIFKKITAGIGALKRVRPFINHLAAIKIYESLIEPHFLYCSSVWDGLARNLAEKLQKLQNQAARAIIKSSYHKISNYLLNMLGWDRVLEKRTKQKAIIMFRVLNQITSPKSLWTATPPNTFRDCE